MVGPSDAWIIPFMIFASIVADQAVMLPTAFTILILLALIGTKRAALRWLAATGMVWGTILTGKLLFAACGSLIPGLLSPSGHTACGAYIAGGLVLLLGGGALSGLVTGGLAGAVVGWSRIGLHAHTPVEVVAGAVVGAIGLIMLVLFMRQQPIWIADVRKRVLLLAVVLALAAVLHGHRAQLERNIQMFGAATVRRWLGCHAPPLPIQPLAAATIASAFA